MRVAYDQFQLNLFPFLGQVLAINWGDFNPTQSAYTQIFVSLTGFIGGSFRGALCWLNTSILQFSS
jgi:hypothetical protein